MRISDRGGDLPAAVWAVAQAAIASAPALQLEASCWQTKDAMTPIFKAEPWLKSAWLTAWKDSSVRPSRPAANSIAGSEQVPKSRAARLTLAEAAALQAAS